MMLNSRILISAVKLTFSNDRLKFELFLRSLWGRSPLAAATPHNRIKKITFQNTL